MELLGQIRSQYEESNNFFLSRKLRQVKQLALLNNLRRGDENIASTLLFSFFNRILSNLYEDKIQVKFVPGEEMDNKNVEMLNKLAINDFREMNMSQVEYDWLWDTLFFGKGCVETIKFDKERKIMVPQVINPLAFGSDPFFSDTQQWRYYWKWVLKPGWEVKQLIDSGVIDGISSLSEIGAGYDGDLWNFKVQRDQAKYLTSTGNSSNSQNAQEDIYQILEIYTTDKDGNKLIVWVDKAFSRILMKEKLNLKDAAKGKGSKWPIVVKELFREPHSSVSFSIPDLIEDKHRAKSVLMNLAFIAAKDEANPIYKYDPMKVKDLTQLFQRQIMQHIPVDDMTAIEPLQKSPSLSASLLQFINLLNTEASDPVGTGVTLNPLKRGSKQTATEAALQQQLNDLSQSLQSKVLQIGEKEFWSHWYQRYLHNTKEGDTKIISLTSVKGVSFETIDFADIKTKFPPSVQVFSAKDAEYKELVDKRDMMQLFPEMAQSMDAAGFKNWNKYVFLPKFVQDSSVIDLVLPDSIDELKAKDENDMLNIDKMPDVKETDNHLEHLYVHASAKNTPSAIAHRYWHEQLLAEQKKQVQLQQQAMAMQQTFPVPFAGQGASQGAKPQQMNQGLNPQQAPQNPAEASVPLAREVRANRQQVQ